MAITVGQNSCTKHSCGRCKWIGCGHVTSQYSKEPNAAFHLLLHVGISHSDVGRFWSAELDFNMAATSVNHKWSAWNMLFIPSFDHLCTRADLHFSHRYWSIVQLLCTCGVLVLRNAKIQNPNVSCFSAYEVRSNYFLKGVQKWSQYSKPCDAGQ